VDFACGGEVDARAFACSGGLEFDDVSGPMMARGAGVNSPGAQLFSPAWTPVGCRATWVVLLLSLGLRDDLLNTGLAPVALLGARDVAD